MSSKALIKIYVGIFLIFNICLCGALATAFAEQNAKTVSTDKNALRAKISNLLDRLDREKDSGPVLREFEALGLDAVDVLLDNACTGKRSKKHDQHLALILTQRTLKKPTFDRLYPLLISDPQKLCWTTANLIMIISDRTEHDFDVQSRLLLHPDRIVRYWAMQSMKHLGQTAAPAATIIAQSITSKDGCLRGSAESALTNIGRPAMTPLLTYIETNDVSVRQAVVRILGRMGPEAQDAIPILIARYNQDQSILVRREILTALARIGSPKDTIIPVLIAALDDHVSDIRYTAVSALGEFRKDAKPAASALRKIMNHDEDERVRAAADFALWRIGPTLLTNFIRSYYIYPIFVIMLCLIYLLFFRNNDNKIMSFLYFLPACFGHPIHLFVGAYVAWKTGFSLGGADQVRFDFFGFSTILLILFMIRYFFFLYNAWIKTRSPMSGIYPHAFDKFIRIHSYCVWGIPLFLLLCTSGELLYYFYIVFPPSLIGIIILAIMQSVYAIGASMTPEKWAPEVVIIPQDGSANETPLPLEERRKRRYIGALAWCLAIMILVIGIAFKVHEHQSQPQQRAQEWRPTEVPDHVRNEIFPYVGSPYAIYTYGSDELYRSRIVEYTKAIEQSPKLSLYREGRAIAYSRLKQNELAIEDFSKAEALSEAPLRTEFYRERGLTYKALGMYKEMCQDYEKTCCEKYCDNYVKAAEEGLCDMSY